MSKFFEAINRMQSQPGESPAPASEPTPVSVIAPAAPFIEKPRDEESPVREPKAVQPLNGVRQFTVKLGAGSPVLPFDGSDEVAAERYRILRTKLLHDPRQPRVLCVSSSGAGDGKSVNAINLAGVLALKREGRVLLVDSDFRRSTLSPMLGIPPGPGLSDVLARKVAWHDALTRISDAPNLYFMPSGQDPANPAELLDSSSWKETCATFKEQFSFVIVDSPPMGVFADYDLIQSACDGVILVARQDHSNRARLLKSIEAVPKDRLIGVVMNCVVPWMLWKTPDEDPLSYKYRAAAREAAADRGGDLRSGL